MYGPRPYLTSCTSLALRLAVSNGVTARRPTFGVDPLRIEVRESGLIAQLLYRFLWLLIYAQNTAGPPSLARLGISHVSIDTTSRRICADVVRDGTGKEEWGRQFDGIEGGRG